MSPHEARRQAPGTAEPAVEQEVDFGRYGRLLVARWWLPAGGVVLGAIIGYLVALGGGQTFQATSTMYLGQPYSANGNLALQTLQTNPSTVNAIVRSPAVIGTAAAACHSRPAAFRAGISTREISGNLAKSGQSPLFSVTVKSAKPKVAACAANALTQVVIRKLSTYANLKMAHFRAQMAADQQQITRLKASLTSGALSTTEKLLLRPQLGGTEVDFSDASQLLLQVEQVEAPRMLTPATAQRIKARSLRNSAVVAGLLGLILGAIAALMWDRVAARPSRHRPA